MQQASGMPVCMSVIFTYQVTCHIQEQILGNRKLQQCVGQYKGEEFQES